MFSLDTEKAQAVLFLGPQGVVTRELLYAEFEALLDGYVPLQDWANSAQQAVYLEFNHQFIPTCTLFFTMAFDARGAVDKSWNLPLILLAQTPFRGPDLGAGPIALVTASQCPLEAYRDWMWEPDIRPTGALIKNIRASLKHNRLGVHFKMRASDATSSAPYVDEAQIRRKLQQEFDEHTADLKKQLERHAKNVKQLEAVHQMTLTARQHNFDKQLELVQIKLEEESAQLRDAQKRNQALKDIIDGQVQKLEGLREYFEHKLKRQVPEPDIKEESTFSAEKVQKIVDLKVVEATSELTELLDVKALEMAYRVEHEAQLRQELDVMKQRLAVQVEQAIQDFVTQLAQKGVSFVTFQPGINHITIPSHQVTQYAKHPTEFVAQLMGVNTDVFTAWAAHYQLPICSAALENGDICGENLDRIEHPKDFLMGQHDACPLHSRIRIKIKAKRNLTKK